MSGKGDKPRPVDQRKFSTGWQRIFGGKKETLHCVPTNVDMDLYPWNTGKKVESTKKDK